MRVGILGTGMVGGTIGGKLIALGHDVMMGSRSAQNPKAAAWVQSMPGRATSGTFAQAAQFGEIVFNCTNGTHSLDALQAAGADQLSGKTVIDVANILSVGAAPSQSLAEQIQGAFPGARVVKTLNTVNADVMVDPSRVPAPHSVFLCGNDDAAKGTTRQLLESFGWSDIIDLGDITAARGMEAYVTLWVSLYKKLGTPHFNIHVSR